MTSVRKLKLVSADEGALREHMNAPALASRPTAEPSLLRTSLAVVPNSIHASTSTSLDLLNAFETALTLSGAVHGACVSVSRGERVRLLSATEGFRAQPGATGFSAKFVSEILRRPDPTFATNARDLETGAPVLGNFEGLNLAAIPMTSNGPTDGVIWVLVFEPRPNGLSHARRNALTRLADMTRLAIQAQPGNWERDKDALDGLKALGFRQCHWIFDVSTRSVSDVSSDFEGLFHLPPSALEDDPTGFSERIFPEDKDATLLKLHTNLESGVDLEFRVIQSSGELRWVWLRSFAIENDDPFSSARLLFVAEDVTARKETENQERTAQAKLAADAKMTALGELAGGVAHEINNPLTIISAKASELKRLNRGNQLTAETIAEIAEKIESTSMRVADIIKSLKGLARRDNPLMRHKVHFEQIFGDIRNLTSDKFARDIQLKLPKFPEGFGAEMHYTQITQLFVILLNNAVDAVRGEGTLNRVPSDETSPKWVEVDYGEDEDSVYLYVTDSGPGIPLKIRGKIFDPFFTTKSAGKGTGLGLSLAQGIVIRHGGSIRLDTLHAHTRFVVQLPKRQGPSASPR